MLSFDARVASTRVISSPAMPSEKQAAMSGAGLFAGIGGLEVGLAKSGIVTEMVCEIDPGASEVLRQRLGVHVAPDIRALRRLPKVDVLAAGFPCQDLSQAGRTAGIIGEQSSLVGEIFKRLSPRGSAPRWLLLENVPFMLQLQQGRAMAYLVNELERLGFTWAYRVIDASAFGIPQRRKRVILLASRSEDPRIPLFGSDAGENRAVFTGSQLCGFYWTEGSRGLGWAVDAIPTLKGGSAWGIPSPPAIWDPEDGTLSLPDIRDAERLQGFKTGWTEPATQVQGVRRTHRWKLVGNAVNVEVARWLGEQLVSANGRLPSDSAHQLGAPWPSAAWGARGAIRKFDVSCYPVRRKPTELREFLRFPRTPLSLRAASGFLSRAEASCLKFEQSFLKDVRQYVRHLSRKAAA
jgi:DNA (cytosine-5)-methyltransferase 1